MKARHLGRIIGETRKRSNGNLPLDPNGSARSLPPTAAFLWCDPWDDDLNAPPEGSASNGQLPEAAESGESE